MRAKRWIERGELDTGGNGLRRILRLLVEHDTVSALRDPSPIGPEFQREGLDLALAESTSVRLTLASETAARACAVGRPSPLRPMIPAALRPRS